MYLYYYLNEKYVGTVDIEAMLARKVLSALIVTDEKGGALLGSLEMMYGKEIKKYTTAQAYVLVNSTSTPWSKSLPAHVYTTSKVGPVLKWDDRSCALCV